MSDGKFKNRFQAGDYVSDELKNEREQIKIVANSTTFNASLAVPRAAHGLVIFVGGGEKVRNLEIADELGLAGFGTLLLDFGFDEKAADKLESVVNWAFADLRLKHLTIGLYAESSAVAASFMAAANLPHAVACLVACGGQSDLDINKIELVKAPALFIVGADDHQVIEYNKTAMMHLTGKRVMSIVAGAGRLFEEPGTLDQVTDLAKDWFNRHLHGPTTKARLIRPAPKKKTPRRRTNDSIV